MLPLPLTRRRPVLASKSSRSSSDDLGPTERSRVQEGEDGRVSAALGTGGVADSEEGSQLAGLERPAGRYPAPAHRLHRQGARQLVGVHEAEVERRPQGAPHGAQHLVAHRRRVAALDKLGTDAHDVLELQQGPREGRTGEGRPDDARDRVERVPHGPPRPAGQRSDVDEVGAPVGGEDLQRDGGEDNRGRGVLCLN